MERIRIALLQIAPCAAPEGGLQKGLEYCARAKELGAYPRNTMILFDRHGRKSCAAQRCIPAILVQKRI